MESLLQDIPSVIVYIDDILISGQSEEEHLQLLERVLDRLERAGLRLKREKCVLMAESVEYLGHRIDKNGLHPTKEKVQAVCDAPSSKNVSELKAYLVLLTYYSKFLPNLATLLAPLYQLLQSGTSWKWSSEEERAFENSKKLLVSSQVLAHLIQNFLWSLLVMRRHTVWELFSPTSIQMAANTQSVTHQDHYLPQREIIHN